MDGTMFKKMKVKQGQSARVLYAPEGYPFQDSEIFFDDYLEQVDLVHLFVTRKQEFEERIDEAHAKLKPNGLLWVSYPKSAGKVKYDINRDIMFDLSIPHGIHPVSMIALDEKWSAMRLVENKPGETYERQNKGK